jgi:AAA domain
MIYADQQNRIEFLPHGLDVLHRLGDVCEKVAAQVDAERSKVDQRIGIPLPTVPVGTSAALMTERLSKTTPAQDLPTKEQIEAFCAWTGEDGDALEDKERALLGDPEVLAKACRQLIITMEVVERELSALGQRFDDASLGQCRKAWEAARTAREAATMAASQARTTDLLPGFGSNAWRLLFQHARSFSATVYPGEPFPVTRDGARCVLCQQPLGRDAIQRFETFDRYVRGAAEADAAEQERKRDAAKDGIATLSVREPADARTMLAGLAGEDAEAVGITEGVVAYLTAAGTRKRAIGAAFADGGWEGLPALAEPPLDKLAAAKARLLAKAVAHEANRDPAARKAIEGSATELRARKTLSASREAVLRRREDLDTLSRLNHCKAACDTKGISRKNSELRRQYLTKDFEDRLFQEIRDLDLAYIPFKVQERSDHGASFLGVGLEAVVKVKNHDILSDGEFRALALACFLTEVDSIAGHNGVIVDDPVSSLDHLRARVVAQRLVREAQVRQVIVFTHDLVFYHELYDDAAELGVPIVCHWIRRTEEHGFGTIAGN